MSLIRPPPAQTPRQLCQAALDRLTATVAVAQGLASLGRTVDLIGLDTATGRLCAQMLDLHPSDGVVFRPALEALGAKLGNLTETIKQPR